MPVATSDLSGETKITILNGVISGQSKKLGFDLTLCRPSLGKTVMFQEKCKRCKNDIPLKESSTHRRGHGRLRTPLRKLTAPAFSVADSDTMRKHLGGCWLAIVCVLLFSQLLLSQGKRHKAQNQVEPEGSQGTSQAEAHTAEIRPELYQARPKSWISTWSGGQ